ncbi:sensor histidine kinase [Nocardioides sp. cx-169]|uniref:sensor histidine kinase n=1 Tax=Nocardioides sp. cx-169 TaxID=2899080 RepID=UPI001E35F8BE|nr:sensor histidine kinase [Nocardioides sp. cx-169]MCD4536326.1 sensor histidine kinase [Nocardioides sp. cx-169]
MATVLTPLLGILVLAPELRSTNGVATVSQVLVFLTVLGAAALLCVQYRLTESNVVGWMTLAVTLYAVQGIAQAGLRAAGGDMFFDRAGWIVVIDVPAALVILCCLRLPDRVGHAVDPMSAGLCLGLLFAGISLAATRWGGELPTSAPAALAAQITLVVVGAGIAHAAYRLEGVPQWCATRLGLGTIALVANRIASLQDVQTALSDAVAVVTGLVGAVLIGCGAAAALRHAVQEQHHSLIAMSDQVSTMEAQERDVRARLHEITNSLAGIVMASTLIHQQDKVPVGKRRQLERMLESEASRLSRLLAARGGAAAEPAVQPDPQDDGPSYVDLDEVIWPLVTAQEAQGRHVEWSPTGHRGLGDPDAVAEVVSILLDNTARHAPGARSAVEVTRTGDTVEVIVRDDGPGIPAEVRSHLYEWGSRGPDSRGQGIGLHLAHRLMASTGSSLRLEGEASGNTFVISIPAAKENHPCPPSEPLDPTHVSSSSRTTCSSPSHSSSP